MVGSRDRGRSNSPALLAMMADRIPAAVWATNAQLRLRASFGAQRAAFHLESEHAAGKTLQECLATDDGAEALLAAHRRAWPASPSSWSSVRAGRRYRGPRGAAAGRRRGRDRLPGIRPRHRGADAVGGGVAEGAAHAQALAGRQRSRAADHRLRIPTAWPSSWPGPSCSSGRSCASRRPIRRGPPRRLTRE